MYKAYIETLQQRLDIADNIEDADVVLFLGAWSYQGFRLAQRSRKMGIPYQKTMCKSAELIIATTPLEKEYLTALGWNSHISLIRYFGYSQLTSQSAMTEDWQGADTITFTNYEKRKAEAIAAKTDEPIIAQIMQIKSRMPHRNIPQKYIDDLHTLLYADNYDEDAIHAELTKQKLDMYAAAVFDAMTEKTGLTEGFMPLPARKGRKSRQILKYIK